jgi:hypothetical protein
MGKVKKSTIENLLVLINQGLIKGIINLIKNKKSVEKEKLNVQK